MVKLNSEFRKPQTKKYWKKLVPSETEFEMFRLNLHLHIFEIKCIGFKMYLNEIEFLLQQSTVSRQINSDSNSFLIYLIQSLKR